MVQKRVHKSSAPVPVRRMRHHSNGFTHDGNIFILIDYVERNVFRHNISRNILFPLDFDFVPSLDFCRKLGILSVQKYLRKARLKLRPVHSV